MGATIMVYLSIVIPSYNSSQTIIPLLTSIEESRGVNLGEIEAVIVDDCSTDDTLGVIADYFNNREKVLNSIKIISLQKNSGPARGRNIGCKYARGLVILFLDADVTLYKKTLFEIVRSFKEDIDLFALTGVWDKKQKNHAFFPKFKALRDWSYWINERDPKNYYYLFSTRVAAIKRDLFLRLGGFDETYRSALVEDIELTYRIAKRYAVVFNQKAIVHHEFEGFWPIAKKYFWRSFWWSRIYRERKKFDPVATTGKEALTTISAGGLLFFGLLSFLSYLSNLGEAATKVLIAAFLVMLFIHLWGVRKFLRFVLQEEGMIFAVKSLFTGIILYLVILSGALMSVVSQLFR